MSIVWIDGFEEYSLANNLVVGSYICGSPSSLVYGHSGRFGGMALTINSTTPITRGIAQTHTVSAGVALKPLVTPANATPLFSFRASDGSALCGLYVSSSGVLTFVRGGTVGSNILGTSAGGVIVPNVWHYVEIEFTSHATAGAVNVYVNGALVLALSGVNTDGGYAYGVQLGGIGNGSQDIDDFYITNTATRLGECKIDTLSPNADTAQKDFTALTGSDNFAMVNELPIDNDTSYVEASTSGNADLYTTGGLASTPSDILAVQSRVYAKKTDTGLRSMKSKLKSGATEVNSGSFALSTDYAIVTLVQETDPATSAAWTESGVNAASIGMELA